jgi:intracellular sulfur oxidation DsrE/DsrF family protein
MLRRSFLSRLSAAAPLLGVSPPQALAVRASAGPARHEQDDWLDQAPDKHRVVFDTWLADKFAGAFGFALNWIKVNKEQYGLTDGDLAVVIVARHGTTPFAFNEAMWTKYGKVFADHMSTGDKVANPNPSANRYAARLGELSKQCLRLAVCNVTLRAYVDIISKQTGSTPEAVRTELTANLIGNAQIVAAGIVAVTRAQERGYMLVSIG